MTFLTGVCCCCCRFVVALIVVPIICFVSNTPHYMDFCKLCPLDDLPRSLVFESSNVSDAIKGRNRPHKQRLCNLFPGGKLCA